MKCKDIDKYLVNLIDGKLPSEKEKEVKRLIESCEDCKKSYEWTKVLLQAFQVEENQVPSERLRTNFYEILEEEKQLQHDDVIEVVSLKKASSRKLAFQIAASFILLFLGFSVGSYSSKEKAAEEIAILKEETITIKKDMMLAMIENQSPSKRIQAVSFTNNFVKPDAKILEALIERMQFDGNNNVRLAAAEALSEFSDSNLVIDAFIEALNIQKDPSLQIAIIQFLAAIQEKRAIAPMQKLLELNETQPYVKEEIQSVITNFI